MKKHISFICKTAFLEIPLITTIRHYLTDDATKTLVVSLVFTRMTIATLFWLVSLSPRSVNFREFKTVQPVLLSVHVHVFT